LDSAWSLMRSYRLRVRSMLKATVKKHKGRKMKRKRRNQRLAVM
jgi:hypothetical protein